MSEHTPGPWVLGFWGGRCHMKHQHGRGDCDYKPTFYPKSNQVSQAAEGGALVAGSCDEGCALSEADARLIASAPELLDKLKKVAAWLRGLQSAAELRAKDRQFLSLAEANEADARNYAATAADLEAAIAKAEGREP